MEKKKKKRKPIRRKSTMGKKRQQFKDADTVLESEIDKYIQETAIPAEYTAPKYKLNLIDPAYYSTLFGIPNFGPSLEVYCRSEIDLVCLDEIYEEAHDRAVHIVWQVKKENDGEFKTIFNANTAIDITVGKIAKIVLAEHGSNKWVVTFAFKDNLTNEPAIDLPFDEVSTSEEAIEAVIEIIADLIVLEGVENPDRSIQKRLFVFSGVPFLVPVIEYRTIMKKIQSKELGLVSREMVDGAFRDLTSVLGDGFTIEEVRKLNPEGMTVLNTLIMHALEYGEWQWPFGKQKS